MIVTKTSPIAVPRLGASRAAERQPINFAFTTSQKRRQQVA